MKNFKLAVLDGYIPIKILLSAFFIFCTEAPLLLDDAPGDFYVMIVYSFNVMAFTYSFFSNLLLNMKFYKTLPLTSSDITVLNALITATGSAALLLGASAVLAPCGKAFMIPYYAGALFIYAAFSLAVMPPLIGKNKYGAEAIQAAAEQSKRRTAFKVTAVAAAIIAMGIPGTVICMRGWKAGTFLMSDLPMLLAIYIGSIAVSVVCTLIYKNKIKYYIY